MDLYGFNILNFSHVHNQWPYAGRRLMRRRSQHSNRRSSLCLFGALTDVWHHHTQNRHLHRRLRWLDVNANVFLFGRASTQTTTGTDLHDDILWWRWLHGVASKRLARFFNSNSLTRQFSAWHLSVGPLVVHRRSARRRLADLLPI